MNVIIMFLVAYLIGAIPFGLIVGLVFYKKDIRKFGSGNLGATNTFRVLGRQAGIAVTLLDMLKGFVAIYLPLLFHSDIHPILVGIFAVLGHVYPVYLKFKGGKAVATSAGVVLGANPLLFIIVAIAFFLVLYLFKYVSLASIIASIVNFVGSLFFQDWIFIVIAFAIMVIVIVRHRTNIGRIMRNEEPKIKWM